MRFEARSVAQTRVRLPTGVPTSSRARSFAKLMARNPQVDPATVDDLVLGCALPEGEQGMNVARMVGRLGGLPEERLRA